jgi:hypothetical protein
MKRHRDDEEDRYDPEDDRPMSEAEWEKMMKESDLRAARFGELLETLIDHPDRNQLVAREMGWNELADALEEKEAAERAGLTDPQADEDEQDDDEGSEFDDGIEDEERYTDSGDGPLGRDEHHRELEQIPAYAACERAAEAINDVLKPFQSEDVKIDEDDGQLVGEAWIGFHIACAKMSGGHAMGYDPDVLGGNIVNNRRGLEGARQSIRAMKSLTEKKYIPRETLDKLMPLMLEAESLLVQRIEELRSKMWT